MLNPLLPTSVACSSSVACCYFFYAFQPTATGLLHAYLVLYNLASLAGWGVILTKTLGLILTRQPFPNDIPGLIKHFSNGYDYQNLGSWVIYTQTFAILEVVHAALGWVRSSPLTVGMQVASRIWMTWGVLATRPEVSSVFFSSLLRHSHRFRSNIVARMGFLY